MLLVQGAVTNFFKYDGMCKKELGNSAVVVKLLCCSPINAVRVLSKNFQGKTMTLDDSPSYYCHKDAIKTNKLGFPRNYDVCISLAMQFQTVCFIRES